MLQHAGFKRVWVKMCPKKSGNGVKMRHEQGA